jgi:erythromycin esterase
MFQREQVRSTKPCKKVGRCHGDLGFFRGAGHGGNWAIAAPLSPIGRGDNIMTAVLDWIRANAIQLKTVAAGQGFADLQRLGALVGNARIVSLGEATHGTREFFQLKHRLLEYLVAELEFTWFGIEANYPECLRVNDYVLNATGDPAGALAGTRFWTWDTEEVLALIEWMRSWNRSHARKIKFYGFDMQFPTEAALGVLDYLKRVAPGLAEGVGAELWPLCDDTSAERFHGLPDVTREAACDCIRRILQMFTQERERWSALTSDRDWHLARLNAVVVDQSAKARSSTISRDVAMAENVATLLELEGPNSKAVLWAHNGHAVRQSPYCAGDQVQANMGSRLDELFGSQHRVISFAFNQGSFQAQEPGRGLVGHRVEPADDGSLDRMLAEAGLPMFLLDLSCVPPEGPVADWLATKPSTRWIGAVFSQARAQDYLHAADPRRESDLLAFVECTTEARPNPCGRRPVWLRQEVVDAPTNLRLTGNGVLPDFWTSSGDWRMHGHDVALSEARSPAGGRTVCISRASAPWRWGEGWLAQMFAATPWRGKRLQFKAAVRAEVHDRGAGAQLYIETRPEPPKGAIWMLPATRLAMTASPVRSPQWATYLIEIEVPSEAHSITIGCALAGNGAAWFGDLELAES